MGSQTGLPKYTPPLSTHCPFSSCSLPGLDTPWLCCSQSCGGGFRFPGSLLREGGEGETEQKMCLLESTEELGLGATVRSGGVSPCIPPHPPPRPYFFQYQLWGHLGGWGFWQPMLVGQWGLPVRTPCSHSQVREGAHD